MACEFATTRGFGRLDVLFCIDQALANAPPQADSFYTLLTEES